MNTPSRHYDAIASVFALLVASASLAAVCCVQAAGERDAPPQTASTGF
jgi:hypothetical protein